MGRNSPSRESSGFNIRHAGRARAFVVPPSPIVLPPSLHPTIIDLTMDSDDETRGVPCAASVPDTSFSHADLKDPFSKFSWRNDCQHSMKRVCPGGCGCQFGRLKSYRVTVGDVELIKPCGCPNVNLGKNMNDINPSNVEKSTTAVVAKNGESPTFSETTAVASVATTQTNVSNGCQVDSNGFDSDFVHRGVVFQRDKGSSSASKMAVTTLVSNGCQLDSNGFNDIGVQCGDESQCDKASSNGSNVLVTTKLSNGRQLDSNGFNNIGVHFGEVSERDKGFSSGLKLAGTTKVSNGRPLDSNGFNGIGGNRGDVFQRDKGSTGVSKLAGSSKLCNPHLDSNRFKSTGVHLGDMFERDVDAIKGSKPHEVTKCNDSFQGRNMFKAATVVKGESQVATHCNNHVLKRDMDSCGVLKLDTNLKAPFHDSDDLFKPNAGSEPATNMKGAFHSKNDVCKPVWNATTESKVIVTNSNGSSHCRNNVIKLDAETNMLSKVTTNPNQQSRFFRENELQVDADATVTAKVVTNSNKPVHCTHDIFERDAGVATPRDRHVQGPNSVDAADEGFLMSNFAGDDLASSMKQPVQADDVGLFSDLFCDTDPVSSSVAYSPTISESQTGVTVGNDFFPAIQRNSTTPSSNSTFGEMWRIPRQQPRSEPWVPTDDDINYIRQHGDLIASRSYPLHCHRLETMKDREDFVALLMDTPEYHHLLQNTVFNLGLCCEKPLPSYFDLNRSNQLDNLGTMAPARLRHMTEVHFLLGNVVSRYVARSLSAAHYQMLLKSFLRALQMYRSNIVVVIYYPTRNYENYFMLVRNSSNIADLMGMNVKWIIDAVGRKRDSLRSAKRNHDGSRKVGVERQDETNFVDVGSTTLLCQSREGSSTGHALPSSHAITEEGGCISCFLAASMFIKSVRPLLSQTWYNGEKDVWVDSNDLGTRQAIRMNIHPENLSESGRCSLSSAAPGQMCGCHSDKRNPKDDPLSAVAGMFAILHGLRIGSNMFLRESLSTSCKRVDNESPVLDRILNFYKSVAPIRRTITTALLNASPQSLIPGYPVSKQRCGMDPASTRAIMHYCVLQLTTKYRLCTLGSLSVAVAFQYRTNVPYVYYVATQMMLYRPPPKRATGTRFGFAFLKLVQYIQSTVNSFPNKQFRRWAMYSKPVIPPDHQEYHKLVIQLFGYAANLHYQYPVIPGLKKARDVYKAVYEDVQSTTHNVGPTISRIVVALLSDLGFFPSWFRHMAVLPPGTRAIDHINETYLKKDPIKPNMLDSWLETLRRALSTEDNECTLMIAENCSCKFVRYDSKDGKDGMWCDVFCPVQQLCKFDGDTVTILSPDGSSQSVVGGLLSHFPCGQDLMTLKDIAERMGFARQPPPKRVIARIADFRVGCLNTEMESPRECFELQFNLMPPMQLQEQGRRYADRAVNRVYPKV